MVALLEFCRYLFGECEGAQGKPPGDPLGQGHEVRLDTQFRNGKQGSRPAEARLDLVDDQAGARLPAKLLHVPQVAFGRHIDAPFALDGARG